MWVRKKLLGVNVILQPKWRVIVSICDSFGPGWDEEKRNHSLIASGSPKIFGLTTERGTRGQGARGPRGQGAKGPRGQGARRPRGQGAKGCRFMSFALGKKAKVGQICVLVEGEKAKEANF